VVWKKSGKSLEKVFNSVHKKVYEPCGMLHSYLPITATSLRRPLSSVPKVAVVERCDCIYLLFCYIHSFDN